MEHVKFEGNAFKVLDEKSVERLVNERNPSFILSIEGEYHKSDCKLIVELFRQFVNHSYNKCFNSFLITQDKMNGNNVSCLVVQLQQIRKL